MALGLAKEALRCNRVPDETAHYMIDDGTSLGPVLVVGLLWPVPPDDGQRQVWDPLQRSQLLG